MKRGFWFILLWCCWLGYQAPAWGGPVYYITDLGPDCRPYGVNNSLQVVGFYWTETIWSAAFLWEKGVRKDLGAPPGEYFGTDARAINDAGQVVGWTAGPDHAILWDHGVITDLSGGLDSNAFALNNVGQVAGSCGITASLWDKGVRRDLGTLPGGTNSCGFAINDAGQVVGYSNIPSTSHQINHAFLWHNGVMQDLGTLPGNEMSEAYAINGLGQVVGSSGAHAFLWQNGVMTDLGFFGYPQSINRHSQVVGYETITGNHAFIWQNGAMQDLNDLIPANSGWELTSAAGINDAGAIIGEGKYQGQNRAFLLTPGGPPPLGRGGAAIDLLLLLD